MMNKDTKFTPGPWRFHSDIDDSLDLCVTAYNDRRVICDVSHAVEEEVDPNGHLIAAAPELYKTLEEFTEEFIEMAQALFGDTGDDLPKVVIKAKQALAKARGEG